MQVLKHQKSHKSLLITLHPYSILPALKLMIWQFWKTLWCKTLELTKNKTTLDDITMQDFVGLVIRHTISFKLNPNLDS